MNKKIKVSDFISVACAAQIRDVKETYIRSLLREGRITGIKIGRDWLVSEVSVREFTPRRYTKRKSSSTVKQSA